MKLIKAFLWIVFFPFMLLYWGAKNKKKPAILIGAIFSLFYVIIGITGQPVANTEVIDESSALHTAEQITDSNKSIDEAVSVQEDNTNILGEDIDAADATTSKGVENTEVNEVVAEPEASNSKGTSTPNENILIEGFVLIEVDDGDLSGTRLANVVVDVGFGNREYWAFTNEYGQLVRVTAEEIILQDDSTEPVNGDGRYYDDEAAVPGTEQSDLDQGHVIADSLGGVANAYNITPQDSTMNRYGDQAYMEDTIRKAGGCTDFEAIITYPDAQTQIPSHYHFTYTINGNVITEDFDNVNPDLVNANIVEAEEAQQNEVVDVPATESHDISSIDTNGNGQVTIKEAKAAGFSMPIYSDHWLYQYMDDRDGDGMVGE